MPLPMYGDKNKKAPSQIKHTIAVASGKGGVGKSTVAVNLALALKNKGFKVGLMDTDVYGPSVRKMLPEDRMPVQKGDRIQPALSHGIRMISMAYFRQEHEAAVVRAPIANGIITQFIGQVDWGELDFLIIDFPPGTGDIQLTLAQQAKISGAIMVTTPQEIAVMDVKKSMDLFDQVQIPVIGVVENMCGFSPEGSAESFFPFGKGGGERLAREAGVPLLAIIPIDPLLCQKSDKGESIFASPSAATDPFIALGDKVLLEVKALEDPESQKVMHPYQVDTINQKDAHSFTIRWKDQVEIDYRLNELQKKCPCANCRDEETGVQKVDPNSIDENVKAKGIINVGRYAIRVDFTSGCTMGIFAHDQLRNEFS